MTSPTPIFRRLIGLETEYAIRFGLPGPSPGNKRIFEHFRAILRARVATRPGRGMRQKQELFTQNGGAFSYEHLPHCTTGGLIEGATPECRSPSQLLLYQKAQDLLLTECMAEVEKVAFGSLDGELGLLKNCRDAEGHRYGAQENYEVDIGRGPWLAIYRLGMTMLLPWVFLWTAFAWLVQVVLVILLVPFFLVLMLMHSLVPPLQRWRWLSAVAEGGSEFEDSLGHMALWLSYGLSFPVMLPHLLLLRLCAFRDVRRHALAFLITRPILTGAGTVESGGRFGLSEKGPAIRRVMRWTIAPADRCVLDPGNLLKRLLIGMDFRRVSIPPLFHRRQRLQLGLSDSNMAQTAELLKVGTTSLVLDMMEDGFLAEAPRLARPIDALHRLVQDPSLSETFRVRRRGQRGSVSMSALEIQRDYQRRAEAYLKEADAPSMEAFQVVRLWGEILDRLERGERESLVGKLDWITKRALLEECAPTGSESVLKTLDLRYHELGNGYLARLEREDLAPVLVTEGEARRAMLEPPDQSPARLRGRWIRDHQGMPMTAAISWDSVHLGSWLRPKVVSFPSTASPLAGKRADPPGSNLG